ncbi:MAG: phosphoglucomutase/phosphomannomutase family protein, partial [Candidatus Omnitrophota bacterium]
LIVHFIEDKGWSGAIVKTVSGSGLIDVIAKEFGLKLYETPVGFKHICKLMQTEDILIGGEESGGIGFKNFVPERDGTLAGLLLLEMMAYRGKPINRILADIEKRFGRFVGLRLDTEFSDEQKATLFKRLQETPPDTLLGEKIIEKKTGDGFKLIGAAGSWLLFRASGTEPILRIYCEARSSVQAKKLMAFGKRLAFGD